MWHDKSGEKKTLEGIILKVIDIFHNFARDFSLVKNRVSTKCILYDQYVHTCMLTVTFTVHHTFNL